MENISILCHFAEIGAVEKGPLPLEVSLSGVSVAQIVRAIEDNRAILRNIPIKDIKAYISEHKEIYGSKQ